MAPITHVPAQVVTVRDPSGYTQRKWQPAHWADAAGNWVAAPTRGGGGSRGVSVGYSTGGSSSSGGYSGMSDQDIINQANAYADSAIAAKQAAIERQRAQAYAQAQYDAAQMGQIGQAQMGMINQIPANIQAIRDTAAQAMASTAGQITGAQQQQQQGELAQNAAFVASQTGGTPQAAPTPAAPTDGAAPSGPIGVNPTATAAAEQAMGGTIPAQAQIQTGESGAIYAAGMPAVVARATQNKIADRMAQAATQDADYCQQLIDAAGERGGIYQTALSSMYDIESKKFSQWEASQRLALDQKAQAANAAALAGKTKFDQWYKQQQLGVAEDRITAANQRAANALKAKIAQGAKPDASLSKTYGHVVDSNGKAILDDNGNQIPVARPPTKPRATKPPAQVLSWANGRADSIAAANSKAVDQYTNKPKVRQLATVQQIINEIGPQLKQIGYTDAQINQIAVKAASRHYGRWAGGGGGGGQKRRQPAGG